MMPRQRILDSWLMAALLAVSAIAAAQDGGDAALVTSLQGSVNRASPKGQQPLEPFVKVKRGDMLALGNARLQLVYFETGRQETWTGNGRLEVRSGESRSFGLSDPVVKVLPAVMVKQIARTPTLDSQGRAGAVRLRSVPSTHAIEGLEKSYRQMRMEAENGDLGPELYFLSGLYEMRQFERIEQVLRDMQQARPGDAEVGLVVALYQKAMKNSREGAAQ